MFLITQVWREFFILGPLVQSIVSLTSLLVVKMLTVLVSTISNSQVFLLKNCEKLLQCKSYAHFFSKNSSLYAIFNDQSFNDTLSNDIVRFERLGTDVWWCRWRDAFQLLNYKQVNWRINVTVYTFSVPHYENTHIQIYRKFHLQKLTARRF